MDSFIDDLYEQWIDEFNLRPLTTERFSEYDEAIRLNQQIITNMYNIRRHIEQEQEQASDELYEQYTNRDQPSSSSTLLNEFFDIIFNSLTNENFNDTNIYEDVKITLTKEQFNKIDKYIINKNNLIEYEGKDCNICMDTYNIDNIVVKLGCGHLFHTECIESWLCKEKISCPVCRKDVREYLK
jgi:hypothetical protein